MSIRKTKIAILLSLLLLVVIVGYLWHSGFLSRGEPPEKITIGSILFRLSGPLYIAQDQGYFKKHGLEVSVKFSSTGVESIKDLRAGRIDLGCCALFVLVHEILTGPAADLRCLTALGSGQVFELIARRDRGISRPEDLRGKAIGLPRGTATEFFLGRFLSFKHVPLQEVTVVDINSLDLATALAAGQVDAVTVWEPLIFDIKRKIGRNAIAWSTQEGQDMPWVLVGREEYLQKKPAAMEKLMQALKEAVDFIKQHPVEAGAIILQRTKFPIAEWENFPLRFELLLDQGLLLFMEDQAAWMIKNRLTDQTKIPNFLDYFYPEPLLKVDPKAVSLVIPAKASPK